MLKEILRVRDEDIQRSEQIPLLLADPDLPAKKRGFLSEERDRLSGSVLRPIIQEVLNDTNLVDSLLKGHLVKKKQAPYEAQVENREKIERWNWATASINGKKVMYDPTLEGPPQYQEIPMMTVERYRTIYLVDCNRGQIRKIEALLNQFLEKCRNEFRQSTISAILSEKARVENEIAKIDRSLLAEEIFSEAEFLDATYIRRTMPQAPRASDSDLFFQFENLAASAKNAMKK